jgi:hypothetical protein
MTSYKWLCFPVYHHHINSRRIKWAGHIVHKEKRMMQTGFWWGNLREQDHWEDQGIILKCVFKKWDGGH